ncbi:MAG TPA: T9SS type A sorting domain-containing protein, partial [Saprospiraceae bacterium]|nr:T9SS type A sorting domain-containing protein [Saprospiraceae bacterium]
GTEFDQFACQGGYDLVVKVQPGTNAVFVGGTGLWRSTDGFASSDNTAHLGGYKPGTTLPFFEIYPNHHPDVHDVLFLPSDPKVLLSASDGGLHRTEDCLATSVTWSTLNRGYHTTQFYTAIIDKNAPNDPMLIGGLQDNGNFHTASADPVAPWRQTVNGDGAYGGVAPGKAYYVLSIQQGKVAKVDLAADGTVKAFRRIDPIGPQKSDYLFINPLALDPADANVLYLPAGAHLYRQNDLSGIALTGVWDSISQGWTHFADTLPPVTGGHIFSAIAVSEKNPAHRVYLGTNRNQLYRIDNAHTGTPSIKKITSPLGGASGYVNCIAIDPDNADHVVMCYSNYNIYSVYRSLNGGTTWQKVAGNLETSFNGGGTLSVRCLGILPFPDGTRKYFCGTSIGLYSADSLQLHSSSQPGTQWTLEGPDQIGSAVVTAIETRASDGLVVAATHGNGIFTANFKPSSSTAEPDAAPLVLISPNPAADYVEVQVTGTQAPAATLLLYDAQGHSLREMRLAAERTRMEVADLPRGVYYYAVRGKGWIKSGKIVLTGR